MVEYVKLTKDDFEEIVSHYETNLNSGEFIREQIRRELQQEDFIGFKAVLDGKVIGLCFGKDALELTYPHPALEEEILAAKGAHKMHCVDALVIDSDIRGHRLSSGMIREYKKVLLQKGYDLVFGEVWIYPDGAMPAEKTMVHFGRPFWERREALYYKDLARYGITCPVCGKNCICGAKLTLYRIEMGGSEDESET